MNNDLTLSDFVVKHPDVVATMTANELAKRFDKSLGCIYQCLKKHNIECKRQRNKAVQDSSKLPLRAALWAMKFWDKDDLESIDSSDFTNAFNNPSLCAIIDKLGPDEVKALRDFVGQPLTENQRKRELQQAEKAEKLAEIKKIVKRYLDQDSDLRAIQARARAIALGTTISLYDSL